MNKNGQVQPVLTCHALTANWNTWGRKKKPGRKHDEMKSRGRFSHVETRKRSPIYRTVRRFHRFEGLKNDRASHFGAQSRPHGRNSACQSTLYIEQLALMNSPVAVGLIFCCLRLLLDIAICAFLSVAKCRKTKWKTKSLRRRSPLPLNFPLSLAFLLPFFLFPRSE